MSNFFYNRIEVLEKDLSGSVRLSNNTVGATVILAPKGPTKPVYFGRGKKKEILQTFGYPSASFPGIAEAIYFNNFRPIWISAPSKNGLYGGVFVTKTGTIPFTNGLNNKEIPNFALIPVKEQIGKGDGSTTTFNFTLDKYKYYIKQSINIKVNNISINVSATDDALEILTTTPDVGSGTYNRTTGLLTFTFTTAPVQDAVITVNYNIDLSKDCYFCIIDKNPQEDDRFVTLSMSSDKVFTMKAEILDKGKYLTLANSPYKFSLNANYLTPAGENIYIENIFSEDNYFDFIINKDLNITTFVNDTSRVALTGGNRGETVTISEITEGWDYFKNKNIYKANIFFDTTALSGVPAIFDSLRKNNQKFAHYILPLPLSNSKQQAITTKTSYSIENRGLSFYWNWGKIEDADSGLVFWSPLTGRIASKHALMDDYFNGLAPCFIDSNGHGGLLGSGIREMRWDLQDDNDATDLENARINPIVNDPVYGVMIIAQRTSVSEEIDYSYISHSRLADYILENIINQVLPYQVTKLNDAEHRALVKAKTESIISVLSNSPYNLIREYMVVCDETNNTDEVLARKEFLLELYLKFTPFSEKIRLIFTNVAQTTDIQELIGG